MHIGPRWTLEGDELYVLSKQSRARAYEALQERLLAERALFEPRRALRDYDAAFAERLADDARALAAVRAEYIAAALPPNAKPLEALSEEPDNYRMFKLYVDSMETYRNNRNRIEQNNSD